MGKIQHRVLYQEAADRIRELIELGTLAPGEKISEKKLCEKFGISRTPLREALKVLKSEGLIEIPPNRGARVTLLTTKDVEHTYDVMAALEGLAGETACRYISDAEVARIRELHLKMVEHFQRSELKEYFRANQQIHECIMLASKNDVLMEMYNNLSQRIKQIRYSAQMTDEYWNKAVNDHENMIEALEDRDGERLGNILRNHLGHHKLESEDLKEMIAD
ncbi:GntR family transcriptional regulator [Marinobacter sp. F3R11]|uniref:GntR family transcriptional regulator n=1 Tax=Marinobacter sp. F3R11 TaxID=2267231 RepID=UPI000DEB435A|nr:GntR family transcriptional regulator [Marinobacter sp. F3R11]RBW50547.1 GntR family transcriptional regulator [Marinobacter sp. F3R11]